eukprot:GEMP01037092.1.p1 GENE.GEMP01037092.1~~GEMP01037092.1.p1  ORF type:complete len:315 (+),score=64.64 GEMP01037092.1:134-1078(+)
MAVREGKGLFSDNGVWINPKVVRETVESLHVSPEWVQELFAENEHVYYPDNDETHALLSFCFLDRINEDVKSRYLPWADEVIGIKPVPMDWKPSHEPEPESVALNDIVELDDDGVDGGAQTRAEDDSSRQDDGSPGLLVPRPEAAEESSRVVARICDSQHTDDSIGVTASASSLGRMKENVPTLENVHAIVATVTSGPTHGGVSAIRPSLKRHSTLFSSDAAHLDPPPSRVPQLNTLGSGSSCENACFCGRNPPIHAVMLRCHHRFCMEHLTTLRARAGTLENGNIVCPFCGDCHEHTITGGYLSVHVDESVMI